MTENAGDGGRAGDYETLIGSLIVVPKGEPIFSEQATVVRLQDEAAGLFVEVQQMHRNGGLIAIDPEEWPALSDAIDRMIEVAREREQK